MPFLAHVLVTGVIMASAFMLKSHILFLCLICCSFSNCNTTGLEKRGYAVLCNLHRNVVRNIEMTLSIMLGLKLL